MTRLEMTGRFTLASLTVLLLIPLPSAPALAQAVSASSTDSELQEITVTATRREERAQDVPISLSAYSQEKLDMQGSRNIDDVTRLSPGVTFQRNGMSLTANYNDENSDINFRGIESTAGAATTGIYIDDTPIQGRHLAFGAITPYPAVFDLDRVEVLRGPQGTLFGSGSEGGAVRFLLPQPNLVATSAYVLAEGSSTEHGAPSYAFGGAFGAPIIDDVLGFRVSASYRRDGGYVDRVGYTRAANDVGTPPVYASTVESNANWWETATLRAALKWKVSDAVSVTPSVYYQRLEINDTAAYWPSLSNPDSGVFRNGNYLPNSSTDPFWLASVKLDWNLDFAQLTSNTAYFRREQHSVSDYTQYLRATFTAFGDLPNTYPPSGIPGGRATFRDIQHNIYEEVRLTSPSSDSSRIVWSAGLFAAKLHENIPEQITDPTLNSEINAFTGGNPPVPLCTAQLPCPHGLIYDQPITGVIDKQVAVFGEMTARITDTLKATVGLRVSKMDYEAPLSVTGAFEGTTLNSDYSKSEKPVTPKAVLSWQPDSDELVYLSASKGFRPGGANAAIGDICNGSASSSGTLASFGLPLVPGTTTGQRQAPTTFNSDSLWSYELGTKSTLLNRMLQINASLFYVDWSNIQSNVYLSSCGEQFVANGGHVLSRGGDLEIIYRPIEPLAIDFTAAYTDAKYTKTSCAGILSFNGTGCVGTDPSSGSAISGLPLVSAGDRLPGAPWSFTASADYYLGASLRASVAF